MSNDYGSKIKVNVRIVKHSAHYDHIMKHDVYLLNILIVIVLFISEINLFN